MKIKKTILILSIVLSFFIGQAVFAQQSGEFDPAKVQKIQIETQGSFFCKLKPDPKVSDVFDYGTCLIARSVLPLLLLLAFVVFAWGVVQYILGAQEEAKRQKGKQFMIWGLIALAVITSIWGLVGILRTTFNLGSGPRGQEIEDIQYR